MTAAARLGDSIAHSAAMGGLLAGLLIGAAVAVAVVAIIGTGGLVAAAMIGAGAASGAGIGQVLGSLSCAPKPVTGTIVATGSFNVYINGIPAARAHVDVALCSQHPGPPAPIAEGSASVSINSQPAARVGDHTGCSAVISLGSQNVFIGGPTTQTDVMHPEVPSWVSWSIGIVGIGAALVLVGPLVAFAGLVGSLGMGLLGNWLGGKIWGEGSDGQKLSMLGGSILGGWMGIKGGVKFNENYTISVEGLGS
ncbi:MAG: PAAR domain-containing protein, partial [Desulfuromonadaceae bacterium]